MSHRRPLNLALLSLTLGLFPLSALATQTVSVTRPEVLAPVADSVYEAGSIVELEGSDMFATVTISGPTVNGESSYEITAETHEWLIYEQNPDLILLGGNESNLGDIGSSRAEWKIETPIAFSVDDTPVTHITIQNSGYVELNSSTGARLGAAAVQPDLIGNRSNANEYNLISVLTTGSQILINYAFASHEDAPDSWSTIAQVVIDTDLPSIGFKLDRADFNDPLFDLTSGLLSCAILASGQYDLEVETPAMFKSAAAARTTDLQANTSMQCSSINGVLTRTPYSNPQITTADLPALVHLTGTEKTNGTAALQPDTTYLAMVRHHADGYLDPAISEWSEPVSFSVAADPSVVVPVEEPEATSNKSSGGGASLWLMLLALPLLKLRLPQDLCRKC